MEERLGDREGKGLDLESTHWIPFLRCSRLTPAVVPRYLRFIAEGSWAIPKGQRHRVDRRDQRDLGIFPIGLQWVERYWLNTWPISIPFIPACG